MILLAMVLVLFAGGLLSWCLARWSMSACRWTALTAVTANLALTIVLWWGGPIQTPWPGRWMAIIDVPWIDAIGARFLLLADGFTVTLLLLVSVVGMLAVAASWRSLTHRVGFFHFMLLWSLASLVGVFTAMDLLLFYLFWEVMLVPLFLMILLWGREQRRHAAMKFILYTQGGGLLLLIGMLALFILHHAHTGVYTFNYFSLVGESFDAMTGMLVMLAFFAAFAVKLPAFPIHGWLPDAHSQAPVAGSVILAGLVLKAGAYGLIRFLVPLFPVAVATAAPSLMLLGVASILYGAILSYAQTDLKRLIAYTSVSHMGFVLLGVLSWNTTALQGVVVMILAHGVATAALFALAGMLHERLGTYDMRKMGGLWDSMPWLGGAATVLLMAALGLPGLANFVGEFLVLLGAWRASPSLTVLAAGGLVLSVTYSLKVIQWVFHGRPSDTPWSRPAGLREKFMLVGCIAMLIWMGVYPASFLRTSLSSMENLQDLRHHGSVKSATVEKTPLEGSRP